MKTLLIISFIMLCTTIGICQKNDLFVYYNKGNLCLPSYKINCMAIDSLDNVWIGTDSGLVKFDKKKWLLYNKQNGLASNLVTAITIDSKNNVWISDSTLSKFDGHSWHHFNQEKYSNRMFVSEHIKSDSYNNIWFIGDKNRIEYFDGVSFYEKAKVEGEIISLNLLNDEIWFNTQNKIYSYITKLKDWGWNINDGIDRLYFDNNNNILVSSNILRVGNDSWNYYYSLYQLVDSSNYKLLGAKDNYGMLNAIAFEGPAKWLGVYYYGLIKVTNAGGTQIIGGNFSNINDIQIDRHANKWINYGGGVAVYNENGVNLTEARNDTSIPSTYNLSQNYPNPFNPETTISYSIPKSEHVTLKVFDVLGREVATLVDEYKQAGYYNVTFNASRLDRSREITSGIYFCRMSAGNIVKTNKLLLLK